MKKITFLIIAISLVNQESNSLDTNYVKYFPLAVGNSWTYRGSGGSPPLLWKTKTTISSDSVMNGRRYFRCSFPAIGNNTWIRIDSLKGIVYKLGSCPPNLQETIVDSLMSRKNDTANDCFLRRRCVDTNNVLLFGSTLQAKQFGPLVQIYANSKYYARNFGPYFLNEGDPYAYNYTLIGCVINGVVYGDTSLTGLTPVSIEVPDKFSISQNYPNPFNPVTNIKFGIVEASFVKLIIYDILGKEITALVNEKLNAGTYGVDWDASDYPSGIYFYKLISGDFSETRKMVLIK